MTIRAEIILSVYGQAGEAGGAQYRLGLLNMVGRPLSSAVATVARVLDALARNDPPRRVGVFLWVVVDSTRSAEGQFASFGAAIPAQPRALRVERLLLRAQSVTQRTACTPRPDRRI